MEESSFHVLSCTVGCNLFKRLAINALLAIASLFTKEKVLQRVLFATMDDVLKEVNEVRSNWYFARTVHDTLALCMDRCTYLMYGWTSCLSSWSFNTHPINFFYFLILVCHWIYLVLFLLYFICSATVFFFLKCSIPLALHLSIIYFIILQWITLVKSSCICGGRCRGHYHRWWSFRMDTRSIEKFSIFSSWHMKLKKNFWNYSECF